MQQNMTDDEGTVYCGLEGKMEYSVKRTMEGYLKAYKMSYCMRCLKE